MFRPRLGGHMHIRSVVVALTACSLLAGCGLGGQSQAEPPPTASSTPTVTPSASSATASPTLRVASQTPSVASPTPTTRTTTPSATSKATDPSASDVFTLAGYGQLRLGMTAGEGTSRGIVRPDPDDVCGGYEVVGPYGDEPLGVTFGVGEALTEVSTNQPGPATWRGAQVGMSWAQVQQRHPDAEIVAKEGNGGTFYAAQIRGEGAMLLFFAVSERDPGNWYGGTLMGHPNWPDAQVIRSMALMPYSDGVYGGC